MGSLIYGLLMGAGAGWVWGLAFHLAAQVSMLVGGIIGIVVALILMVFGKLARAGGHVIRSETSFINISILTMLGMLAMGTGVVALIARYFLLK